MRLLAKLLFYPTWLWTRMCIGLGLRHRWDWVDDGVLLGTLPKRKHVPMLAAQGIGAVVNTCLEYPAPEDSYRSAGIEVLNLLIVDFTPPTLDEIHKGVEFIRGQLHAGRKVYVHCKAGRGRSATIVLCYLIQKGFSPEEAQRMLLEKRPYVIPNLWQRPVVQQYAQEVQRTARH